jgi:hypothetical protein
MGKVFCKSAEIFSKTAFFSSNTCICSSKFFAKTFAKILAKTNVSEKSAKISCCQNTVFSQKQSLSYVAEKFRLFGKNFIFLIGAKIFVSS